MDPVDALIVSVILVDVEEGAEEEGAVADVHVIGPINVVVENSAIVGVYLLFSIALCSFIFAFDLLSPSTFSSFI